jgi:hypothetical protein
MNIVNEIPADPNAESPPKYVDPWPERAFGVIATIGLGLGALWAVVQAVKGVVEWEASKDEAAAEVTPDIPAWRKSG